MHTNQQNIKLINGLAFASSTFLLITSYALSYFLSENMLKISQINVLDKIYLFNKTQN